VNQCDTPKPPLLVNTYIAKCIKNVIQTIIQNTAFCFLWLSLFSSNVKDSLEFPTLNFRNLRKVNLKQITIPMSDTSSQHLKAQLILSYLIHYSIKAFRRNQKFQNILRQFKSITSHFSVLSTEMICAFDYVLSTKIFHQLPFIMDHITYISKVIIYHGTREWL
jgi:hypothetical protein